MTDRELLELVAQKINGLDQKVTGLDQKVTGLDQRMSGLEHKVTEHGEILQAVRHAQEIQSAKMDKLEIETARLSGKIEGLSSDLNYIVRKSAQNADEIRELRQVK